ATIVVKGTAIGTATNLDGSFSFAIKTGKQTLVARYVGYITKEIDVTIKPGENTLETISLKSNAIGLQEIKIVSSFARDRQTPVAVSTIKPEMIEEKIGTKEFPEILKSTPSVYATKRGGGYGDGRINLRGFDSNNIGVLINGVPVNDMESGKVYWSNWAGLSDVTRTMQVQRGLGASKLALSSVGGTINILTKTTDAKKGGSVYGGMGHNGFAKKAFTFSTGLMDNGFAVTLSGSMTTGDGYATATNFEAYSYFMNISKQINKNHIISFTAFGAPQWHNQRSSHHLIQDWRNYKDGIRHNSDYGIRNGEIYNTGYAYNEYHKPQISLNHFWKINKTTNLSTAAYFSMSNGGGRRVEGPKDHWLEFQYPTGAPYSDTKLTADGLLDYDAVTSENANSLTGSQAIMAMSVNRHDWYGLLSTLNKEFEYMKLTAGFDGRYYKGYHYKEITDLMGGDYYLGRADKNRDNATPLQEGDKISYYNLGEVLWEGLFTQAEYTKENYSGFVSASLSNTSYRRTDFMNYLHSDADQVSDWENFVAYSVKGGFNYNFTTRSNVFVNAGYFTRAPYFRYVFKNYRNDVNEAVKHEKAFSSELGYGYKSKYLNINATLYHTEWLDKAVTKTIGDVFANLTGLDAIHQGIELEARYHPTPKLNVNGMISVGDWTWSDNVIADIYDQDQVRQGTATVYAKDLHVGDAAQTTASLSVDYKIFKGFKLGGTINHFSDLYASFDVENRTSSDVEGIESWKLPSYEVVDAYARYNFKLGGFDATLVGNVDNLLDVEYIADGVDGVNHDATTSPVYYGYGRTWSIGLKLKF
ncbi:MAG: TonB-dependent receptor, partial [Bacteroidota bacterium]|nr:TonB-dependent receptor [Bacteroidota bacterium]